jgi:hypothetical protein
LWFVYLFKVDIDIDFVDKEVLKRGGDGREDLLVGLRRRRERRVDIVERILLIATVIAIIITIVVIRRGRGRSIIIAVALLAVVCIVRRLIIVIPASAAAVTAAATGCADIVFVFLIVDVGRRSLALLRIKSAVGILGSRIILEYFLKRVTRKG